MNPMGRGSAHAKAILIGEHAVVYGQPALVLPLLPITVHVEISLATDEDVLDCAYYRGHLSEAPAHLEGFTMLIRAARRVFQSQSRALAIAVTSAIPPGYGLGSSAAVAVGIVRALYDFHQRPLTLKQLLALTHIAETRAHGTPSGVDAWATSSERPLWFVRGQVPEFLHLRRALFLVVANSRAPGNTHEAVRQVRESRNRLDGGTQPIKRLGELAKAARPALVRGDYESLGTLMTTAHEQLTNLHITTDHVDTLVSAALRAGALGAKLTGSGGGGSIIALAANGEQQRQLTAKLTQAGAPKVWTPVLKGDK